MVIQSIVVSEPSRGSEFKSHKEKIFSFMSLTHENEAGPHDKFMYTFIYEPDIISASCGVNKAEKPLMTFL